MVHTWLMVSVELYASLIFSWAQECSGKMMIANNSIDQIKRRLLRFSPFIWPPCPHLFPPPRAGEDEGGGRHLTQCKPSPPSPECRTSARRKRRARHWRWPRAGL